MENQKLPEDEINFKDVASNPIRWFGIIYPLFLVIMVILGFFYINNLGLLTQNKVEASAINIPKFSDIELKKGSSQAGLNLNQIAQPTDEVINKGKELYSANCASCHGSEAKGDGPAGVALNPAPRNLTLADNWKNGRKLSEMFKTLQEGIKGGAMAAYEYLPVADRFAIIHYIRTFAEFPKITPEELSALDAEYSISQGKSTPNQIPIALAMNRLAVEHKNEKYSQLESFLEMNLNNPMVQLFNEICYDKKMAIVTITTKNRISSFEQFKSAILSQIESNGFNSKAARLESIKFAELYSFLNSGMIIVESTSF